jgi:arylsulfatase A-like enzyme
MSFFSIVCLRDALRHAVAIALACAVCAPSASRAEDRSPQPKPNIVFFLIDDLGWKDLSCLGSGYYETPNIDRLAAQAMVFTSAYANGPNCAPSRACLMTGLYAPRHGIYTVGNSERGDARLRKLIPTRNKTVLDQPFVTIAEVLKTAGYATASMGKWHLGPDPTTQGFDVNIGGNRSGSPRGGYFSPYRNAQLPDGPPGEYLTDRLTDEALRFIEAHHNRPFFLYLTHYAVHTPLQAKSRLVRKYRRKAPAGGHGNPTYAAMIESVDQSVGRVLDRLDALGIAENTVVVFFSDNGGYGPATSMAPLRGSKGMLYEGGIRVPLIVRWPGKTAPGSRCDVPVIGVDLFPTIRDMAGATPPEQPLDGESLVPLLTRTGSLQREALFWHFPAYLEAYRGMDGPFRTTPAGAVRKGDYKLIEFFEDGRLELYDLRRDLGEKQNLVDRMPERARQLHEELKVWRRDVAAPVPAEPNPAYLPAAVLPKPTHSSIGESGTRRHIVTRSVSEGGRLVTLALDYDQPM